MGRHVKPSIASCSSTSMHEQDERAKPSAPSPPLRLAISLMRPIGLQLVPLAVCLALVPVVVILSVFSGWYVWRNVAVGWEANLYLQYGDGVSPYAEISLPPLVAAQPYDMSLHLVLPASPSNYALGNFMATLTLSTPSNRTLTSTRRPSIALPPAGKRRYLLTAPPSVIHLDIPLLVSYFPGTSKVNAKIELGRRDDWKNLGTGEGRELSVLAASIRGSVKRQGIRGLVSRFPFTSAVVSSTTFFVVSLLALAACILPAIQWRFPSHDETFSAASPTDRNVKVERLFRTRKRQRKAAGENRQQSSVVKAEEEPVDISPALAAGDQPLKRRRSRASDALYDSET
ncbi:hypothetical protein F5I97DRAFT_1876383 [Phlebopus sp. FC_14]|nr:hypothetical protein F5I97DRAFT_1876383 [Phlebopus sp. FC_14]